MAVEVERHIAGAALLLAILGFAVGSGVAAQDSHQDKHWVGTWAAGPTKLPTLGFLEGSGRTLREIVHTSIGGDRVRARLSNLFGTKPLLIGAAHIAICEMGPSIVPGSDRALTFNKRPSISIPPGALVLSDPVNLAVPALGDLAVSLYLPKVPSMATGQSYALQTSYVCRGKVLGATILPSTTAIKSWFWLTGVDVWASHGAAALVAFGASITAGGVSAPDTNHRWTNILADRLLAHRQEIAVLNEGIGGNRLLHHGSGPNGPALGQSALARFDRDVLAQAGVRYMVVADMGLNDLGQPPLAGAPPSEEVSANDLIAGLYQLVERAHETGVLIFGATLTPFEGAKFPGYYTPKKEAEREAVNRWIRTSNVFDGVIDFDKAMQDPDHPARLLPAFDSGDHVHPNDRGQKAMGDAIALSLFR